MVVCLFFNSESFLTFKSSTDCCAHLVGVHTCVFLVSFLLMCVSELTNCRLRQMTAQVDAYQCVPEASLMPSEWETFRKKGLVKLNVLESLIYVTCSQIRPQNKGAFWYFCPVWTLAVNSSVPSAAAWFLWHCMSVWRSVIILCDGSRALCPAVWRGVTESRWHSQRKALWKLRV